MLRPSDGPEVRAADHLAPAALATGLEDFCEALGLTGIDLVANDAGGAIAQIFAAVTRSAWPPSHSPTAIPPTICRPRP